MSVELFLGSAAIGAAIAALIDMEGSRALGARMPEGIGREMPPARDPALGRRLPALPSPFSGGAGIVVCKVRKPATPLLWAPKIGW